MPPWMTLPLTLAVPLFLATRPTWRGKPLPLALVGYAVQRFYSVRDAGCACHRSAGTIRTFLGALDRDAQIVKRVRETAHMEFNTLVGNLEHQDAPWKSEERTGV